ncbi:MAG TPA: bifunctional adenosylcobinamide kinase/adenosylcobinamide-phosphate guanylyltransferase [Alphaproteobacteria bacterium]|nr:bifunctional adenosylcobinamide kinase/adenosylcobinamide-phosphate guanylyltransferase [Alphaproteobacteria bacterium]
MISQSAVARATGQSLLPTATLVLGGARAGKSAYAETLIMTSLTSGDTPIYIATAEAGDQEMRTRIEEHRARRGQRWTTIEAPLDLVAALRRHVIADQPALVDCLTLWLANLLAAGRDVARETERLVAILDDLGAPVVLVSNEVGLGIVPDNALARAFRDHAGRLNQAIAAAVPCVVMVAAGLPIVLKNSTRIAP